MQHNDTSHPIVILDPPANATANQSPSADERVNIYPPGAQEPPPGTSKTRIAEFLDTMRRTFDQSSDAILIAEVGTTKHREHSIVYVNPALEKSAGYAAAEMLGKTLAVLHGKESDPATAKRLLAALSASRPVREELFHYRKDGSHFCAEISVTPITDHEGRHTHWLIAQRNVDEHVCLREQLKASQARLQDNEDQLRLGIAMAKLALMNVDYVNQTAELSLEAAHIFGMGESAVTVPRADLRRVIHPQDVPEMERRIAAALEPDGSGCYDLELRVICPDGDVRWIHSRSLTHFEGEGAERHAVKGTAVLLDITEAKRADLAARQNEKRFRQLAGGIAHDFNNLLTVMIGHAAMLADSTSSPTDLKHTQAIREAAQTAASITKQLLTLSGKHMMAPELLEVNRCISHLLAMVSSTLGPKIEVKLGLAPNLGKINMNAAQFDQVLLNLVLNARDAMAGGGTIHIATANVSKTTSSPTGNEVRRCVRVQVRDCGSGIPADVQDHLFEPFFTTKPPGMGTGLGLSIVRALVEEAGGHIMVHSVPGEGACFDILIPRAEGPERPHEERVPAAAPRATILVAEDEEALRTMLYTALSHQGYRVLAASNGRHALTLANAFDGEIGLLLSDVRMPELDGPSLAHSLKRLRPNVKTLLMSGFLGDTGVELGNQENDWIFVEKPFSMAELLKTIRHTLPLAVVNQ